MDKPCVLGRYMYGRYMYGRFMYGSEVLKVYHELKNLKNCSGFHFVLKDVLNGRSYKPFT